MPQSYQRIEDVLSHRMGPRGFIEHQLANLMGDRGSRCQGNLSAVRMAKQENRFANLVDHRGSIPTLILQAMPFGGVGFTTAAPGDS